MASGVNSLRLLVRSARECTGANVVAILKSSEDRNRPIQICASFDFRALRILRKVLCVPADAIRAGLVAPHVLGQISRRWPRGFVQGASVGRIGDFTYSLVCYRLDTARPDGQSERDRICLDFVRTGLRVAEASQSGRGPRRIQIATHRNWRVSADERTRREVADVLHGPIQTKLLLLGKHVHDLAEKLPKSSETCTLGADLALLESEIDDIRERDVRHLSHRLYPDLIDVGLGVALQGLANDLSSLAKVHVAVSEDARTVDGVLDNQIAVPLRLELYRVAEEAINNAIRHGRAQNVSVCVDCGTDDLMITITDDGVGYDQLHEGFGIRTMRARARRFGGTLAIHRLPGLGCQVSIAVPRRLMHVDHSEQNFVSF